MINEPPETLYGLVARYSPSGEEQEAVAWLLKRMRALGFERVFRDGVGNAVGIVGGGAQQVVLLGHIDTVPGELPVRVDEGMLYGRGAVDAKGALAGFVDAVSQVGRVAEWQFVVIGAVEEERESLGARYLVERYHPDYLIVGEPSGWERITLGYKGSAVTRVVIRREGAHSASERETACEAAVDFWEQVRSWAAEYNQGRERLFERVLPRLRDMASGEDGMQQWAELRIATRLPPEVPPEQWFTTLEELARPSGARVTPQGFPIPAYRASKNTPLVRAFLRAIRGLGLKPGFLLKTGTSDLNVVAPVWQCPAVVYGPGDAALDHTPNERLSLKEYQQAVEVLVHALRALSG